MEIVDRSSWYWNFIYIYINIYIEEIIDVKILK